MNKREKYFAPRDVQIKRLRWKYGFSEEHAGIVADLDYGEVKE